MSDRNQLENTITASYRPDDMEAERSDIAIAQMRELEQHYRGSDRATVLAYRQGERLKVRKEIRRAAYPSS